MRTLFVAPALVALLAACPSHRGDESQRGPSQASTATGNPQAAPQNATAMNPITPPNTPLAPKPGEVSPSVNVHLTEYAIEMPDTLIAGVHTFTVTNAGKVNHNFAIEGPGVSMKLAGDLPRGDSADLTAPLQKGTYKVYCPVDGHRGKGMQRTITVQ
jgi:plastocyanin